MDDLYDEYIPLALRQNINANTIVDLVTSLAKLRNPRTTASPVLMREPTSTMMNQKRLQKLPVRNLWK
jgi:hypothetical protein